MTRIVLHSFTLGDCEDPEIYAAYPILEWEQSEMGVWAKEFAGDLSYHIRIDPNSWGHCVDITGELDEIHQVEFALKWL